MSRLSIAHLVNLRTIGGVERSYVEFIRGDSRIHEVEHHTILAKTAVSPLLEDAVRRGSRSVHVMGQWGPLPLSRRLPRLRRWNLGRIVSRTEADILLIWNRPRIAECGEVPRGVKTVYYERGASWYRRDAASLRRMIENVSGVLCNSRAAKRMLELQSGVGDCDKIHVCLNAIRSDCSPREPQKRHLREGRPLRLGIAGRIVPVKGVSLLIHAMKILHEGGTPAVLRVAGKGEDLEGLKGLARDLGLEGSVEFPGLVSNMSEFFRDIDCFASASIREPFGLVCAEALAHGCPVIGPRVDGIPEVVDDGETGFCLAPTLPLSEYPRLGGSVKGLPAVVYDPDTDTIGPPKILDPAMIAAAVQRLVSDGETYERLSREACRVAADRFDFDRHVEEVLNRLASF